ncbi:MULTISPECIES: OmpA family protein [Microcystis]|jgi:flagellar motor protein MotB|uniref:OmpA family protein n=4 Tax=Microcystis TaxID=1125 RepID=A0A841USG0_MICAE|nr:MULTISPECIES: OmpA family protein [Microcystis]MCA2765363.1 OmpA family protein [Microcystis sp. M151S2]MCA2928599.1 OmpA family protein [Microcystis sp. M020S1]MCA2934490.1 OmpA family protein [Microcystis sp. M015S1]MCU7245880.1 OmpA family protein [Microcystis aeruginosa WS75]NCQ99085.1 OmpA family protein [Microcystis aeruginosa L211-11]NCR30597.1 OmpA family protein [Microcystis aeruginosa L211-101]NCR54046.1 OmpA family protein [Microcystis aeruginosa L211-07]NCS02894.1 OmpA family
MSRRTYYRDEDKSVDVYPAFTDLMSNAFMILSLFLLLALFQSYNLISKLEEANRKLQTATPIVIDEKSGKFKFQSGSAELNPALKTYIRQRIIPAIETITKDREIDFIQVIGHTDGQGIQQTSNLDKNIESVASRKQSVKMLVPGSNTDLGLMRALAVVQEIENTGKLKNVKFRAFSAGQLYLPSGKLAAVNRDADASRRRIEIRFIPPGKKQ